MSPAGNQTRRDRSDRFEPEDPKQTHVVPITGYGDYTAVAFEDVDFADVDALVVECLNDQGVEAAVATSVGRVFHAIDLSAIDNDDLAQANTFLARCLLGLNVPDRPERTEAMQKEAFEALTGMHACLVEAGFDIEAPPTFAEWNTQPPSTRWEPLLLMMLQYPNDADDVTQSCRNE